MVSEVRKRRIANQVTKPYSSKPRTAYQIQVFRITANAWHTLPVRFRTEEEAVAAALDGNTTPVGPAAQWRIIRTVSSYEVIGGQA